MESQNLTNKKDYLLPVSIMISALIIAGAWIYTSYNSAPGKPQPTAALVDKIRPTQGIVLPVTWGDLGRRMTENGVIDASKFEGLLTSRGEFTEETKNLLYNSNNKKIKITPQNANTLLNFFWALGLGNKNEILERGPMAQYGNTDRFASTGGWTLAKGGSMMHYSAHQFINLTSDQQKLVEEVSRNIYRPCCNNPTDFPDCNHGLALLGLLELMASQGASKEEMYRAALAVNSYWFPDQYLTIAKYLSANNIQWDKVSPEKILASAFSSASGFEQVQSKITQPAEENDNGGSCGV